MAAKKDKMIPSEKERKRALKYATPAGTGRMWVTMGIAFIIFGIILLLIPIGLVISEASAQRYDPESIHTATLVFYLLGAFFGFCGCFCVIFGKLAVKAFAKILCKGEINYPVAEYKTPKKLLLQEAAAINQSPNAPLTASTFGNWIDFEADWQNCLSIYNGILQSHQIFKKLILVQDNFTYKELDYENNSELGVGVKTFAAGSTTTIGKMKGHKLIYNIGMNLSNGKLGVNSYSIDTLDVTNPLHGEPCADVRVRYELDEQYDSLRSKPHRPRVRRLEPQSRGSFERMVDEIPHANRIRHQVHQEGYVAGTQFRRYNSGHHCGCHERCSRYLYREVHGRVLFGVHQQ